jgi:spore maturation protein SpmA
MNIFFVLFIATAVIFAGFAGTMREVTEASFQSAKDAVTIAIGLVGIMALWLGMVRVLEAGGLMQSLANAVKPVMVRLFPDVPASHPAMSTMLLNISANMLGLGNAATPLGIKAMVELNKLNPFPGTATNAMCLFLAINTSSVTILPLGVIGIRAAAGSIDPAGIILPTLLATLASTLVGVSVALVLAKKDLAYRVKYKSSSDKQNPNETKSDDDINLDDHSHLVSETSCMAKIFGKSFIALFFSAFLYRIYVQSISGSKRFYFY